jgi:hypothetical protein
MYAAQAGKLYLKIYNQNRPENERLSAKAFFDKVIFPLFFNAEKYLINIHNSSFSSQAKVNKQELEREIVLGGNEGTFRLKRLHAGIAEAFAFPGEKLAASNYVGFAAAGQDGTTAGQTSNIAYSFLLKQNEFEEEIYASWIAAGLAIGVKGGNSFILLEENILKALAAGWKHYREILNESPTLKGNQIDTWNGIWLSFLLNEDEFHSSLEELPRNFGQYLENYISKDGGKLETVKWTDFILGLAKQFPKESFLGYIFQYGQTNTTIGFIPIYLPEISDWSKLFGELFGAAPKLPKHPQFVYDKRNFMSQYESRFGLQRVCQRGNIGLYAFEPHKWEVAPNEKGEFKLKEKDAHLLQQQILWVAALLAQESNKTTETNLFELADSLAKHLYQYQAGARSAGKQSEVINFLETSRLKEANKQKFIQGLADILRQFCNSGEENLPAKAENFYQVVKEAIKMPAERFLLFINLIYYLYIFYKTVG